MRLPTGVNWKDVREVTNGGKERILWSLVDPWIVACSEPGDLSALAAYLRISMKAMAKRRTVLGLPPTRPGRPRSRYPTPLQLEALAMKKALGPSKAAQALNTTPGAVSAAAGRAVVSFSDYLKTVCPTCQGNGVTPCRECKHSGYRSGDHAHVCDDCLGTGKVKS